MIAATKNVRGNAQNLNQNIEVNRQFKVALSPICMCIIYKLHNTIHIICGYHIHTTMYSNRILSLMNFV